MAESRALNRMGANRAGIRINNNTRTKNGGPVKARTWGQGIMSRPEQCVYSCTRCFKGLMAIGRKSYATYAYQTDLRRNGTFVRTVRVTPGRNTYMTLNDARMAAAKAPEQIRSGVECERVDGSGSR